MASWRTPTNNLLKTTPKPRGAYASVHPEPAIFHNAERRDPSL